MQALAAGGLQKRHQPAGQKPRAQFLGRLHHAREIHARRGIDIEDHALRRFGIAALASPGVEFQHRDLRQLPQSILVRHRKEGLLLALHLYRHQIGNAVHHVPLEEVLSADPVRRAHDGERPPRDMRQNPLPAFS